MNINAKRQWNMKARVMPDQMIKYGLFLNTIRNSQRVYYALMERRAKG